MTEEQYQLERDILADLMRKAATDPSNKMELLTDSIKFVGIAEYCGLGVELAKQLEQTQDEAIDAVIENKGNDEPWFQLLKEFAKEIKLKRNVYPP
jgi:hypothetical protein